MLFSYPSFIGQSEENRSKLLFNSVRIVIQTHVDEIWVDQDFGTNIRNSIKEGIDNLVLMEIRTEIETKLNKYFNNELKIENLEVWQELNTIKVKLDYIELQTGIHYTIQTEEIIVNQDQTLY